MDMWDKMLTWVHARAPTEWGRGGAVETAKRGQGARTGKGRGAGQRQTLHIATLQNGAPSSLRILHLNPGTQRYI